MPGRDELLVELVSNDDAAGKRERRKAGATWLVPQGGFEPSTYRLRSDCSAVELLRRSPGEPCSKEAGRCGSNAMGVMQLGVTIEQLRF
jgi:hypothetical protein